MTQFESDGALRGEFRRLSRQSDSALCHDDLAWPNDPVYFRDFVAHAGQHGLAFLAEAKLSMMSNAGVSSGMLRFIAGLDRLAREQYLDFARFRRFRSSLLCRKQDRADFVPRVERLASLRVCASSGAVRAAAEGKLARRGATEHQAPGAMESEAAAADAILRRLVDAFPRAPAVTEVVAWHSQRLQSYPTGIPPPRRVEELLLDACVNGAAEAHAWMAPLTREPGERPLASALARYQAGKGERVTNLRHETLTLSDARARRLLTLLNGERSREQLATAMSDGLAPDATLAAADLEDYLEGLAKHALLVE